MTTIKPTTALKMGLDTTQPSRWQPIVSAHRLERVPVVHLTGLQVGGQRVEHIEVAVMSLPASVRVEGLLGVNFLHHFRPTFEFDQATLVLR